MGMRNVNSRAYILLFKILAVVTSSFAEQTLGKFRLWRHTPDSNHTTRPPSNQAKGIGYSLDTEFRKRFARFSKILRISDRWHKVYLTGETDVFASLPAEGCPRQAGVSAARHGRSQRFINTELPHNGLVDTLRVQAQIAQQFAPLGMFNEAIGNTQANDVSSVQPLGVG
jgi:hypothetical protein